MAGGLIQLLAWGSQNIKLNGNPSITFFKKVLRSHSNFSMESIRVPLNRTDANVYSGTTFKAKLPRHGDLVQQVYLVFELPDILFNPYEFKWVENIGEAFIDSCYVTVGGALVDRQYGEYIHINNMLTLGTDKREVYDRMIGNVIQLTNPKLWNGGDYPFTLPAIRGRKVYVPLTFWFNKEPQSSLPLVCLQYTDTEITIDARPIHQLYRLFDPVLDADISPNLNNPEHRLHNFVYNEERTYMPSETVLDIRAYLEVNYYFVDAREREQIAYNSHEYLVEQVVRIERFGLTENNIFELILQNPVKEFIWVLKRDDQSARNSWFDFTDGGSSILSSAKIIMNGMDRIDEKDWMYFNFLQPLQHHKGNPKDGIYVYSFSLDPEDMSQPSGSCNMSRINKVQFMMNLIRPIASAYGYNASIYAVNYNFLKITGGLAGVVFSS